MCGGGARPPSTTSRNSGVRGFHKKKRCQGHRESSRGQALLQMGDKLMQRDRKDCKNAQE